MKARLQGIATDPPCGDARRLPAARPDWRRRSARTVTALAEAVEYGDPGVEVFSIGQAMEVVKQVGRAQVLRDAYCLSTFQGIHGIGHTRLATESRVDMSHCHPFWARPYADIAVVHNGQITNYHRMRRSMEGARRALLHRQ